MTVNDSQLHIVTAGLPAAPLLAELHEACFDAPWDVKAMSDLLSMPGTSAFVIGPAKDIPAGFVIANCAADQADILTIGVLPDHRRSHLASRLLYFLADQLRSLGVDEVYLEVAAENGPAINLYKSCGYIEVGRRDNYYAANRSDRTAVQMKCDLNLSPASP